MNLVVILILAAVWAVFLIPQIVRARAARGSSDSIGAFQKQLSVLQRTTPAAPGTASPFRGAPVADPATRWARPGALPGAPRPVVPAEARRRRKLVLISLLAAAGTTLVLGLLPSLRPLLIVHLLVDVLLVGYVALLVHLRSAAWDRANKVAYLPEPPIEPEPELLLRRSAN